MNAESPGQDQRGSNRSWRTWSRFSAY